jgi:hypothetical protein
MTKYRTIWVSDTRHYKNVPLFKYSNDKFEDVKRRDIIKIEFAKNKGLRLIVIPYNVNTSVYLDQHLKPLI